MWVNLRCALANIGCKLRGGRIRIRIRCKWWLCVNFTSCLPWRNSVSSWPPRRSSSRTSSATWSPSSAQAHVLRLGFCCRVEQRDRAARDQPLPRVLGTLLRAVGSLVLNIPLLRVSESWRSEMPFGICGLLIGTSVNERFVNRGADVHASDTPISAVATGISCDWGTSGITSGSDNNGKSSSLAGSNDRGCSLEGIEASNSAGCSASE